MDVGAWLCGLGLGRYEPAFRDNEIDAEVLLRLTVDDLKDMGVTAIGHRRKLLDAINALRARGEAPPPRDAEAGTAAAPQAERRQLTVMFCDLVGSTALAAALDPEDMREVIRAYQDACAGAITCFGGTVAKYMGDGVLAYFGWPQAHEDAAERAVQAGLELVEAVGRLTPQAGRALRVRVGIATGLVVVGDLLGEGGAREEAVVGETPNLAARLQVLAEPDTVVVAPTTRRLIGAAFECIDLGSQQLKGFPGTVNAWRVLGASRAESRFEARGAAGLTPLVGREDELALLLDRWKQAKGDEGQVVLLVGEPGIGKSRLVRALRERLEAGAEPHTPLLYQCSPYHKHSAFHPVVDQLERAAGFERNDAPAARLAKLEALLARSGVDVASAAPLLVALLALPTEGRYPPLGLAPQRRKELTLEALLGLLAGLATRVPALTVYEDVHWADPSTLELLGFVIERARQLPVLALVTFRPEFAPPWTGHAHMTSLVMGRLDRSHGAAMVDQIAGGKPLPEQVLEQIVAKTDGVPLFVEELTKTVLEAGLLKDRGDRYVLAGPLPPLAIPDTLHGSLLARLDRLAPAREAAQVGAVIGREFGHELLAAVARMPADRLAAALEDLVASELVFRRGTPPDAAYSFKHALVRDAAYGTLLKSRRRLIHARIAATLEERFPETAETQPELLARHCAEAGLTEKAVGYWYKAGRRSMAQSASAEAVTQLMQALELLAGLPAGVDRDRQELDLQIALGGAFVATKGFAAPEVGRAYGRARELCTNEAHTQQLLAAMSGLFVYHHHSTSVDAALEVAEELLHLARRRSDTTAQVAGHRCLGAGLLFNGQLRAALAHFEQALALYDPADHASTVFLWSSEQRVACLNFEALVLLMQGYSDQALAHSREGLAVAHQLGHAYSLSHALHLNCWLGQIRGEPQIVRKQAGTMMSLTSEHGFATWSATAAIFHGWALASEGEVAAGIAQMRHGTAAKQAIGELLQQAHFLGLLAGVCTRVGNPAEALDLLAEALALVDRMDERWFEAELHRLKGEALLRTTAADVAAAEASFRKAIDVAREQDAKWWELRAATSLARLWAERGERRKARDLLAPICGWFTEGFDTLDLKEAGTLLDELR